MELEAALVPPIVRLNYSQRRYILRALKLDLKHPIRVEFEKALQSLSERYELEETSLPKNPSTIESIVEPIFDLVNLRKLEKIRNYYYPLWGKNIPYSITISDKPKEEEAESHIRYLNTICYSKAISIYTDGSQLQEGLGVGLSIIVYKHDLPYIPTIPIDSKIWNIGLETIVYDGELEAIAKATEYASNIARDGEQFNIFSDNQAGLLRLNTLLDRPGQS